MHQRIAGVASHDDRHDHHEHRDAVHRGAPRQAFAAERMQAGDQQPRKHAADDESADMRLPCNAPA